MIFPRPKKKLLQVVEKRKLICVRETQGRKPIEKKKELLKIQRRNRLMKLI